MQFASILHLYIKNRWCPVNLGLVRKVMMDDIRYGEFIDSSLDPKKPIRKWFHMTWKCLEFCIPILGGLPQINRSWRWRVGGVEGGPVKTHLTTGGKADECLRGRYIHIFFLFFSRCLVLMSETYLLNSGHFFGFFLVNFELTQPSPSIATSRT